MAQLKFPSNIRRAFIRQLASGSRRKKNPPSENLSSRHFNFYFLLLRLNSLPIDHWESSSYHHPFTPTALLSPDMGVSSSTVVSDRVMTHASILKAGLINQLPYWVTEQTNFGPAQNPLAVSINTDTRMNACTHTQWDADGVGHFLGHVL